MVNVICLSSMDTNKHAPMAWSQITNYIIIGTNLCCTRHANKLYDLGTTADIDLQEQHDHDHAAAKVPTSLWLPTPDLTAPSIDQLYSGTALLAQLVDRQQTTYVHCRLGHGRAPTLVAAYFIRTGFSPTEAVDKVAAKRPEIHLESSQLKQLDKFAKLVQP